MPRHRASGSSSNGRVKGSGPSQNIVEDYVDGILSGRIPSCLYIQQCVSRFVRDLATGSARGLTFSEDAAERAALFFPYLTHSKGEWAGTPLLLSPWQQFINWNLFGWMRADGFRRYRKAYIEVPRKNGKALARDTPLATPSGWTTMGDVKVGDRVFDEVGLPCLVTHATEMMDGHACFALTFSDGSTIVADAEHEWRTSAKRSSSLKGKPKKTWAATRQGSEQIRTTREIYATFTVPAPSAQAKQERTHRLALAAPLQLPALALPIPPYTLGAWLGDGTTDSATITCGYADLDIIMEIQRDGISTREIVSHNAKSGKFRLGQIGGGRKKSERDGSLQTALSRLGVLGQKHIPTSYLRASIPQRLALLQGLMDTDGHCSKAGQCEFSTTNERLRDGIMDLLCGLGLKPRVKSCRAMLNGRDCGPHYRVLFHAFSDVPVFRLARKRARQKQRGSHTTRSGRRQIIDVHPVPSVPVKCITVDAPSHLYLAGPTMIPTHNSTWAAGIGNFLAFADDEPGAEVYCLDPSTKIMREDLSWCAISELRAGDRLFGFDEHPPHGVKGGYRKARCSIVIGVRETFAPAIRLTLTGGREVVCSHGHLWLARNYNYASNLGWRRADKFRVGDVVRDFGKPWQTLKTYDAGYLAASFDGEGNFHAPRAKGAAFRFGFTQLDGLMLSKVQRLLEEHGFEPKRYRHTSHRCWSLSVNGLYQVLRLLGSIMPVRLHDRHREIWEGRALNRSCAHLTIEKIEYLTAQRLVDIETTTKTFIAEGLFSHNCAATKKDQARIVHGEAVRMVRASPDLRAYILPMKDSLSRVAQNQKFEPLGADEDTMDGLNPHGAIIDEIHAHKNSGVYDKIETAVGARRQPLIFSITTAGVDQTSLCWDLHSYSLSLLSGSIEDDSFFSFVATKDEGDAWDNPQVWAKANPNLGISVKQDQLAELAKRAAKLPSFLNSFLRLHLNVWTKQVKRWISMNLWDDNAGTAIDEAQLSGRFCYGGLDLSSVSDISALVLLFPDPQDEDKVDMICRFWCPEDRVTDDENKYKGQYEAWKRDGFLETTPGNAIDYQFIREEVLRLASCYELRELAVDRLFQGYQLAMELAEEGMTVVGVGMGFLSMAGPSKEFDRRLLMKKLHHGGHPVLRWMAENCAVREDPAGNMKPDKANSQGKIDGIISTLIALDRCMRHNNQPSVYERRGMLELSNTKMQDGTSTEPQKNAGAVALT